jgi:hypothetical protein
MKPTKHRREAGTQIVEFAIVLPLLALLALLVTEGAGVVRAHQVLNNAAREGARLSISEENARYTACNAPGGLGGCTSIDQDIVKIVQQYAYCNGVPLNSATTFESCGSRSRSLSGACTTYSISIDPTVTSTENGVTSTNTRVVVTCAYRLLWLPRIPFFATNGPTVTLAGRAEFRNLFYW